MLLILKITKPAKASKTSNKKISYAPNFMGQFFVLII